MRTLVQSSSRHRPVLAAMLLPSLLLIGLFSYYPAVRSLIGGAILITLASQFTAAEVVTHMPPRAGTVAKYLLVLPIVLPPLILIEVWAYLLQPQSRLIDVFLRTDWLPQPTWLPDPHQEDV
jgi:ABC-type sugar transport system permease subunit